MDPLVLRQKDRIQLSYNLPHEAFASYVYPRKSSNGSTVIVYGYEQGLRVAWYGGRHLKPVRHDLKNTRVNGSVQSEPMVIDLDSSLPAASKKHIPAAEFEDEDQEFDPSAPYPDLVRYMDIPLETAASRIASPYIPQDLAQAPPESWPTIYAEHMVLAVACSDCSIRVVSIPLDPPSLAVTDVSEAEVQIFTISGPSSHPEFISDIAITHTADPPHAQDDGPPRGETRPQVRPQQAEQDGAAAWSLLVASISCSASGLLLVHQIPLDRNDGMAADSPTLPVRRQYLRFPATGARLAFNTCPFPAERHSTLLITLPAASCAKLYQVFPTAPRDRRGSTSTLESMSSTRSARPSGDRGKFLMTFLASFTQGADAANPRRKRVLDSQWVAGGRAVIGLLEDGAWGIWDLEAVGPASSKNLIRGQANISGIQGGSLTRFSIRSGIHPLTDSKPKSSKQEPQPLSGSLAPMSPSTRKMRADGLFQGAATRQDVSMSSSSQDHGGRILVTAKPATRTPDESVVISYAGENVYISSIWGFWKTDSKPIRLPAVRLGGQGIRSLALLPPPFDPKAGSVDLFGVATSTPDFLVQTDHRLIFSIKPLTEPTYHVEVGTQTSGPPVLEPDDQALLASGELDVDGMDKILDDMAGGGAATRLKSKPLNIFNKSIGFRLDNDDDVSMASPTPVRFSPQKALHDQTRRSTGPVPQRRIFS